MILIIDFLIIIIISVIFIKITISNRDDQARFNQFIKSLENDQNRERVYLEFDHHRTGMSGTYADTYYRFRHEKNDYLVYFPHHYFYKNNDSPLNMPKTLILTKKEFIEYLLSNEYPVLIETKE